MSSNKVSHREFAEKVRAKADEGADLELTAGRKCCFKTLEAI